MNPRTDTVKRLCNLLVLLVISACSQSNKGTAMNHSDAEGLWQQAREIPVPGAEGNSLSDTYTFKYERGLVTLRLLAITKVSWRSPDDFYTLKSQWHGDMLQYLAPVGRWTDLAVFEGGQFVATGDGHRREYARVTPDEVADFNSAILKPDRPVHDYQRSMK